MAREGTDGPAPHAPRVPAGTRAYAIGDIHGQLEQLKALHGAIRADAVRHPGRRHLAVYLGDYIDRGPSSKQVVDHLLDAPLPGFECVYLTGNHEALLRGFLADPGIGRTWFVNGGNATCLSYGLDTAALLDEAQPWPALAARLGERLDGEHRRFYEQLRLFHVEGDYAFVHAGVRPGVPLDRQEAEDLLWIREPFLYSNANHGKVVVHGHTPTERPERLPNRIGIDTGAVYGGRLTALVLEGCGQEFLEV